MPDVPCELDAEDAKLVTLARAARARIGAVEGAAVRDRTAAPTPRPRSSLPSLTLSALQAAVAAAVAAGAEHARGGRGGDRGVRLWTTPGYAAVRDLSPDARRCTSAAPRRPTPIGTLVGAGVT